TGFARTRKAARRPGMDRAARVRYTGARASLRLPAEPDCSGAEQGAMTNRREQRAEGISTRERWAYRIAFAAFAFFTVFGVYLLWRPTDFLSDLYAVLLLVTLGLGVIS